MLNDRSDDDEEEHIHYEVYHSEPNQGTTPTNCFHIGCSTDHTKYIPVETLGLLDLPQDVRSPELLRLIKHHFELTVMVCVKNGKNENGNTGLDNKGTGSICYFSDTHNAFDCCHGDVEACHLCHVKDCPFTSVLGPDHFLVTNVESPLTQAQLQHAHLAFRVSTNLHVIRTEQDAKNTTVTLFYHSENMAETVTAAVACLYETWAEQDKVHLICVMEMNARVQRLLANMRSDILQLFAEIPPQVMQTFIDKYVVVVSHPHGEPMVVSVGRKVNCRFKSRIQGPGYVETTYQVETCCGCSGAPVVGPGWVGGTPCYRVHCGYIQREGSPAKLGVSKSHWIVGSDPRGGCPAPPSTNSADADLNNGSPT